MDKVRQITPLTLMPMSEWEMKPCGGDASDLFGVGIYARSMPDGRYYRQWFKWPWGCVPNNIIGVDDLIRCGVMEGYLAYLDRQEAAFQRLDGKP